MKPTYKATFWILAALLTGALLGGTGSYWYFSEIRGSFDQAEERIEKARTGERIEKTGKEERNNQPREERFLNYLKDRLQLDDGQQAVVRRILESSRDRYRAIHEKANAEFSQVRMETRKKILEVLHPDQVEEFNKMLGEKRRSSHLRRDGNRR